MDHIRMHRELKPFKCKNCGLAFAQQGNRNRHQKKGVCVRFLNNESSATIQQIVAHKQIPTA